LEFPWNWCISYPCDSHRAKTLMVMVNSDFLLVIPLSLIRWFIDKFPIQTPTIQHFSNCHVVILSEIGVPPNHPFHRIGMDFPLKTIQLLGYPVYGNPHIFIDNASPFSSPGRTVLSSWLAALHSRGCPSNGTGRQIRKKVDHEILGFVTGFTNQNGDIYIYIFFIILYYIIYEYIYIVYISIVIQYYVVIYAIWFI